MHILNKYFDKIYCINIDRRVDRWNECEKIFTNNNIDVVRWSAIEHREGWRGLISTNIEILEHAESNNFSRILILEDDIVLGPNFSDKFNTCVNELPEDWDLFYFSGTHQYWPVKWSPNVSRMVWTYTTHAVGIQRHMYRTLLWVLKKSARPIDVEYGDLQPHFKCFCAMPHIASQADGWSDIKGENVTYSHLL